MREHDWLTVLEFGRVDDGQASSQWDALGDEHVRVGLLHDREITHPASRVIGFRIQSYSEFLRDLGPDDASWEGPRFHVPQIGLESASVAEIAIATDRVFPEESTPNRYYFNEAAGLNDNPGLAVDFWRECLGMGDCMAHFGLGTTLFDLGQFHAAYTHLRYYAEIAPSSPWTQRWYGAAAESIGEYGEALAAYDAAIALDALPKHAHEQSDADELKSSLLERIGSKP